MQWDEFVRPVGKAEAGTIPHGTNGALIACSLPAASTAMIAFDRNRRYREDTSMTKIVSRLAATLIFCGTTFVVPLGTLAQAQDLHIGFLAPRTGIFAQLGIDMTNGFQMYLDEHGGKLGGVPVKFTVEDTQGKPDVAVAKANKLILQDKVTMLVGGVLATTGYALAPVSTREKILYIGSIATADNLGQRDFDKYPYMVRPTFVPSQPSHPLGQWACEQGYKRVATVAADYAFGQETLGGFQKAFEDCGGKVVQKLWPPIGTKDFGPYIPTLKSDIDAIFTLMVGPMSLQFPKQLRASGNKKPIIAGGTSYDEFILPSMGDEVIGDVSAFMYSAALDTPKNADFVKKYRAKYGKVPSYYSEANYTTAQWIDETLKKESGKFRGALEFIKTMQSVKVDAVRGPVSLDDRLTAVQNIYIKKVEKKKMFGYDKPELWNTVIKTYPNVSQFWTYDKAKFLAQPVYSRDFPPCKFCE
jgi:branched-chain amino acid transport system substrate-binding protein